MGQQRGEEGAHSAHCSTMYIQISTAPYLCLNHAQRTRRRGNIGIKLRQLQLGTLGDVVGQIIELHKHVIARRVDRGRDVFEERPLRIRRFDRPKFLEGIQLRHGDANARRVGTGLEWGGRGVDGHVM